MHQRKFLFLLILILFFSINPMTLQASEDDEAVFFNLYLQETSNANEFIFPAGYAAQKDSLEKELAQAVQKVFDTIEVTPLSPENDQKSTIIAFETPSIAQKTGALQRKVAIDFRPFLAVLNRAGVESLEVTVFISGSDVSYRLPKGYEAPQDNTAATGELIFTLTTDQQVEPLVLKYQTDADFYLEIILTEPGREELRIYNYLNPASRELAVMADGLRGKTGLSWQVREKEDETWLTVPPKIIQRKNLKEFSLELSPYLEFFHQRGVPLLGITLYPPEEPLSFTGATVHFDGEGSYYHTVVPTGPQDGKISLTYGFTGVNLISRMIPALLISVLFIAVTALVGWRTARNPKLEESRKLIRFKSRSRLVIFGGTVILVIYSVSRLIPVWKSYLSGFSPLLRDIFGYGLNVLPFLLLVLGYTMVYYYVDRHVRKTTWSLREFLGREFLVLFALLLFAGLWWICFDSLHRLFPAAPIDRPTWFIINTALWLLIFSLSWPYFIFKLLLRGKPAPASLRETVDDMSRQAGVTIDEVFILPYAKGRVANAFVYGLRRKLLYLTDYLLVNFTEEEFKSIIAHELGHVRYRHILRGTAWELLYFVALAAALFLGKAITGFISLWLFEPPGSLITAIVAAFLMALVSRPILYMRRRYETEADLFVIEIMGDPRIYMRSLSKLGRLNFIPGKMGRLENSRYTHPSIERRIRHLGQKAGIPAEEVEAILREDD